MFKVFVGCNDNAIYSAQTSGTFTKLSFTRILSTKSFPGSISHQENPRKLIYTDGASKVYKSDFDGANPEEIHKDLARKCFDDHVLFINTLIR